MKKSTQKVLNNAYETLKNVEKYEPDTKFAHNYINDTLDELHGYAATLLRFGNMTKEEYAEVCDKILEIRLELTR